MRRYTADLVRPKGARHDVLPAQRKEGISRGVTLKGISWHSRHDDRVYKRQYILQLRRPNQGDEELDERGGVTAGDGNEFHTPREVFVNYMHHWCACRKEHLVKGAARVRSN